MGEWLHFYSHGWFYLNWLMDQHPPPSFSLRCCCWQSVPPSIEAVTCPFAPLLLISFPFPSAKRLCPSQAIVSMINLCVAALATVGNNTPSCFGSGLANVFPLCWKMSLHFLFSRSNYEVPQSSQNHVVIALSKIYFLHSKTVVRSVFKAYQTRSVLVWNNSHWLSCGTVAHFPISAKVSLAVRSFLVDPWRVLTLNSPDLHHAWIDMFPKVQCTTFKGIN